MSVTYFGFAAIWEDGVNLGYSTNLMDIATNAALVNLAGQEETKVGIITNIELFEELFNESILSSVDETDNSEDYKIDKLDKIYKRACSLIESQPDDNFYLAYIEREHVTLFYNGNLMPSSEQDAK
jgi:membrane-anchored protein YejM (alkaline phosphatase superfamily)